LFSTTSIGKVTGGAGAIVVDVLVVEVDVLVVGPEVGEAELEGADVTAVATVVTRPVVGWRAVAVVLSMTDTLPDDPSLESELQEATEMTTRHEMTGRTTDEQRIPPGSQGEPSRERMLARFVARV
jgi:hypothetical protein